VFDAVVTGRRQGQPAGAHLEPQAEGLLRAQIDAACAVSTDVERSFIDFEVA
jgi:hypothetical protein